MKSAIGIDIGGTNTKFGLVSEDSSVHYTSKFPTDSEAGFENFIERIKQEIEKIKKEFSSLEIIGIGIGAPNANSKSGCIEQPPNLKWENAPIINELKKSYDLPVYLENDANVAGIGEKIFGAAKDLTDFIVVTLGTGIGTGIYVNDQLLTGPTGTAGEGGHITIIPNGRQCHCGNRGHLECYASVRGIKITTKEVTDKDLKFAEIVDLYNQNDKDIRLVFKQTAEYLALGLSSMQSLFCPEAFVLTGGISNIGEKFRSDIENHLNQIAFPVFKNKSKVLISEVSTEHGAIMGAASLAFHHQ